MCLECGTAKLKTTCSCAYPIILLKEEQSHSLLSSEKESLLISSMCTLITARLQRLRFVDAREVHDRSGLLEMMESSEQSRLYLKGSIIPIPICMYSLTRFVGGGKRDLR